MRMRVLISISFLVTDERGLIAHNSAKQRTRKALKPIPGKLKRLARFFHRKDVKILRFRRL